MTDDKSFFAKKHLNHFLRFLFGTTIVTLAICASLVYLILTLSFQANPCFSFVQRFSVLLRLLRLLFRGLSQENFVLGLGQPLVRDVANLDFFLKKIAIFIFYLLEMKSFKIPGR